MSYAIFTIYYGVPISPDNRTKVAFDLSRDDPDYQHITDEHDSDLDGLLEDKIEGVHGFESKYSGSAEVSPIAFGIKLGKFDECEHDIAVSTLKLEASADDKAKYQALYDGLEEEHRKVVDAFGPPHVFFLVSTS
jgi:hypothetical protein